jgi:hypothetical protein
MFICECGVTFNEEQEGAREHVTQQHLDLVETRFEDWFDDENSDTDAFTDDELYEEAVEDVTEELLDHIPE